MIETWLDIAGFDGAYQVSNLGRIRRSLSEAGRGTSAVRGRVLASQYDCNRYIRTVLYDRINKKYKSVGNHTAVLETFVGLRPEHTEASHKNGIRDDNKLTNLCWETRSENHKRKLQHGTQICGEMHKLAKLKNNQVIEIRQKLARRERHQSLANEYGVSRECIKNIARGQTWSHIV